MACSQYNSLFDALVNFEYPPDAVICPFASDLGLGLGVAVFGMFVFGFFGLGLSIRTQHPGPILIVGILSGSVVAASVPGIVASIIAIVVFFGLGLGGFAIYQRAQQSL
jgi:hypothetical protein